MTTSVETRVDRLEDLMAEVLRQQARTEHELTLWAQEQRETKRELALLAEAQRETGTRLAYLQEHTTHELDRLSQEMSAFKDEMRAFKGESEAARKEQNKRWGELANKMGTLVEDIVAPSIPRSLREVVGCAENEITFSGVTIVRRIAPGDRPREFDAGVVCREYALINETKSRLTSNDADEFVTELPTARLFFPEYASRRFIGALASLQVDASAVNYGEQQGLLLLGLKALMSERIKE